MKIKNIYLEPAWKMHSFYQGLMANPPSGYEFVTFQSRQEKLFKTASKINLSYSILNGIDKIVPIVLTKAYLERFRKIPLETDLTYSFDHLIFRKEPWVVDVEFVSELVSLNIKHFERCKGIIQKSLASSYCKKIICWTEGAKKTILLNLDCSQFEHKIETVNFAVHKKNFIKLFNNDKIQILFVGSANIVGEFETKGGREAIEAFVLLNKKYANLELVIRSDVPPDIKEKYLGFSNIRIIDEIMPWEELEREFLMADIFLLPVHNTPFSVFLDAMSYELPIVTINAWTNPEVVDDGNTGLLAKRSEKIPYYVENLIPNFGTTAFRKAIQTPDPKVVHELAEKAGVLIEDAELRRKLGKAGRWEVENGRFCIEKRNEKLKKIFDEALGI